MNEASKINISVKYLSGTIVNKALEKILTLARSGDISIKNDTNLGSEEFDIRNITPRIETTPKESPAQSGTVLAAGRRTEAPGCLAWPLSLCPELDHRPASELRSKGGGAFGLSPLRGLVRASLLGRFHLGLRFSFLAGTGCHLTGSRWRILSSGHGSTHVNPGRSHKLECLAFPSLFDGVTLSYSS